jgi:hypothetical protein
VIDARPTAILDLGRIARRRGPPSFDANILWSIW